MFNFDEFKEKIENALASGKLNTLDFRGVEPEKVLSGLLDCTRSKNMNVIKNASKVLSGISNSSKVPKQYIDHIRDFEEIPILMTQAREKGIPTEDIEQIVSRASNAYRMKDYGNALNLVKRAKGMLKTKLHAKQHNDNLFDFSGFGDEGINDNFDNTAETPEEGIDLDGDGFADNFNLDSGVEMPPYEVKGMETNDVIDEKELERQIQNQVQNMMNTVNALVNNQIKTTMVKVKPSIYSLEGNMNYNEISSHHGTGSVSGDSGTVIERWGYTLGLPVKVIAVGRVGERDVVVAGAGNYVIMFSDGGKVLWRYPVNGDVQSLRLGKLGGKDVVIVGTDTDIYVLSSLVDSYARVNRISEDLALKGVKVRPVRDMLKKAEEAAKRGEHEVASKLISQAENTVNEINDQYENVSNLIGKVSNLATHPKVAKSEAEELLNKAKGALNTGDFMGAFDIARKAEQKAKQLIGLDFLD